MLPSGFVGERGVSIGKTFTRWIETQLQMNANVTLCVLNDFIENHLVTGQLWSQVCQLIRRSVV